jgi:hypothetical protein
MRGKKGTRDAVVHHSVDGMFAIRQGDWKLALGRGSGGFSDPKKLAGPPAGGGRVLVTHTPRGGQPRRRTQRCAT